MGQGKYKGKLSGVVALTCRHMFLLPSSIVDLIGAEKYRYTDFALVSGLQAYLCLLLLFGTYDIHCQYIINLRKRLREQFGVVLEELDSIVSAELPEIVAGIGKYHLCMHKGECRYKHSLHFLPGSCMTDGETLERIWAVTNAIARRTKEMSAGHRIDVLNDHYSDLNVRRVHGMVDALMDKLKTADEMATVASDYLANVESTVEDVKLCEWRAAEMDWKAKVVDIRQHKGLENPYEPSRNVALTSEEIAQQLEMEIAQGDQPEQAGDVGMVQNALTLLAQRKKLRKQVMAYDGSEKARSRLATQVSDFRDKALACREKCEGRIDLAVKTAVSRVDPSQQRDSFPMRDPADDCANGLRESLNAIGEPNGVQSTGKAKKTSKKDKTIADMLRNLDELQIPLPSDYHSAVRAQSCMADFVKIERALREGEANDALDVLRLHLTTYLSLEVRKTQGEGVVHNTIGDRRLQEKRVAIEAAKQRYREVYHLLRVLGMPKKHCRYKPLRDEDCKPFTLLMGEQKLGDSYKLPTWIWGDFSFAQKLAKGQMKNFVSDAARAHWFRHSALKTRWEEEVNVRLEEMWRTATFFAVQEAQWLEYAKDWERAGSSGTCVTARRRAYRWTRLRRYAEEMFPPSIYKAFGMPVQD
ncbi:hypothetical protein OH77DRAFT_121712 [Trametes cingulata]|nr:hypothetical protein OH77DRAFT_121712 [Trametes cingulata]